MTVGTIFHRTHIDLPADQIRVLAAVRAVNERVVVVLSNGSAVATEQWELHAGAILEAWLGGQAGAEAVVDVLLGLVIVAATLESGFGYCIGCKVFAALMRLGLIPAEVCERCNNVGAARAEAA